MKRRCSRLLAAAVALSLTAQSTGAASLPVALMHSPAAFPPPAARFAAFPPKAAPAAAPKAAAGPSWLESARVVSAFVMERVREGIDTFTPAAKQEPLESLNFDAAPAAEPPGERPAFPNPKETGDLVTPLSPGVNSPADRMMIAMAPGTSVEGVYRGREEDFSTPPVSAAPAPTLPAFHEKWIEQNGLRARVTYLRPHGMVQGDARGFTAVFGGLSRRVNRPNEPALRRTFPVYFHGEEIEIELTVQNKTGKTLRRVTLEAVQETFRPVGTEGVRLAPPAEVKVAETLAPGASATVHWRASLFGPAHEAVNLEQTHVKVAADGSAKLDAPQAGVIDPPGPGWK